MDFETDFNFGANIAGCIQRLINQHMKHCLAYILKVYVTVHGKTYVNAIFR